MMKTIGIIGGMSWQATLEYYRLINEGVGARLGGHHSAKILISSVEFSELLEWTHQHTWEKVAALLVNEARRLERAGADFLLISANTPHKFAPEILSAIQIPFLHIIDVTAEAIRAQGLKRIALLGTKITMTEPFYHKRLASKRIQTLTPHGEDLDEIHRVIFEELVHHDLRESSRNTYKRIIASLGEEGAEGVILGCTEIPLLIQAKDTSLPLFDTTKLHAAAAVEWAIGG